MNEENECSCKACQKMCTHSPCLATPDDVLKLIELGHKNKLSLTLWATANVVTQGKYPIVEMVQLKGELNGIARGTRTCVMFDNGKCSIHTNKPLGGKLAHHSNTFDEVISREVKIANLWLKEKGRKIVENFKQ